MNSSIPSLEEILAEAQHRLSLFINDTRNRLSRIKVKNEIANVKEEMKLIADEEHHTIIETKINMMVEEFLEDFFTETKKSVAERVKSDLKKLNIDLEELTERLEQEKEWLAEIDLFSTSNVEAWHQRLQLLISNERAKQENQKSLDKSAKEGIANLKFSFLEELYTSKEVENADLVLKKCLLKLSAINHETVAECETYLKNCHRDYVVKLVLPLIGIIENEFQNSLNQVTSPESLVDLYNSLLQKYPRIADNIAFEDLLIRINKSYQDLANEKGELLYSEKNFEEARKWLEFEHQSDAKVQYLLGKLYKFRNDSENALKWFEKAANQENAIAQLELGDYYRKDDDESFSISNRNSYRWYLKSAKNGNVKAQFQLAECYVNTIGAAQSFSEAFKWYEKAATSGNADAQYKMGMIYSSFSTFLYIKGGVRDYNKAIEWFEKSANQGNPLAQETLASYYYEGILVPANYEKAFKLYEKAAGKGIAIAQLMLGHCYNDGNGVRMNCKKAQECYEKAVKNGCEIAKNFLK